jgi:hypothetical protein
MSDRSIGTIILGIIAIAGLGLSGFMFIKDNILFPVSDTGLVLVGLWDDLDRNTDYASYNTNSTWLIEFRDSLLNNSNYVTVSRNNTRFVLSPGLYKITLSFIFSSMAQGEGYAISLIRTGSTDHFLADHYHNETAIINGEYYASCSSVFVQGNGVDYFDIKCASIYGDSFDLGNDKYNQLSIEYIK